MTKLVTLTDFHVLSPVLGLYTLEVNWIVGYQTLRQSDWYGRLERDFGGSPDGGVDDLTHYRGAILEDVVEYLGLHGESTGARPLGILWL